MTVEIWSDVICPFCYIGKRKFETALAQLPNHDQIDVVWRSFQLQPDTQTDPTRNAVQNLAEKKGWTLEVTREAIADVSARARLVGLTFDYDRTVVANTFDAHRLAHFAASRRQRRRDAGATVQAYFVDGQNIADHAALTTLAVDAGLPADEVRDVLSGDAVRRRRPARHRPGATLRHPRRAVLRLQPHLRGQRRPGQLDFRAGPAAIPHRMDDRHDCPILVVVVAAVARRSGRSLRLTGKLRLTPGRYIGDHRAHQRNSIARPLPHSPSILPLQQRRMPDLRGAQPIRTGRNPDALQIQSSNSVPPDNLFPGSRPEMSQPVQVE